MTQPQPKRHARPQFAGILSLLVRSATTTPRFAQPPAWRHPTPPHDYRGASPSTWQADQQCNQHQNRRTASGPTRVRSSSADDGRHAGSVQSDGSAGNRGMECPRRPAPSSSRARLEPARHRPLPASHRGCEHSRCSRLLESGAGCQDRCAAFVDRETRGFAWFASPKPGGAIRRRLIRHQPDDIAIEAGRLLNIVHRDDAL